jgi:hypothetical protein
MDGSQATASRGLFAAFQRLSGRALGRRYARRDVDGLRRLIHKEDAAIGGSSGILEDRCVPSDESLFNQFRDRAAGIGGDDGSTSSQ